MAASSAAVQFMQMFLSRHSNVGYVWGGGLRLTIYSEITVGVMCNQQFVKVKQSLKFVNQVNQVSVVEASLN